MKGTGGLSEKKEHITAFYLETLILILVFVAIILVLTQVFGISRVKTSQAKDKTSAVCLSQNAAECFAAAKTKADFIALLDEKGNVRETDTAEAGGGQILARYKTDMTPDPEGALLLVFSWKIDGSMRRGTIRVTKELEKTSSVSGKDQLIYSLDTAVYDKGEWQ